MKKDFDVFYNISNEEFEKLWSNCIFVFDTNVFLNLYRYTESTKNQLITILKEFSKRIWMPHHVGLEYHINRLSVMLEQVDSYRNIINKLDLVYEGILDELDKKLNGFNKQHPSIEVQSIYNRINDMFKSIISELKEKEEHHPDLYSNDVILNDLTKLFEGKVGQEYNQDRLDEIYKEGEFRYSNKIPPGFEDEKNKKDKKRYFNGLVIEDMYGDLIIWNQILDEASKRKVSVIFVTSDNKEDWWHKVRGRTIGPRFELKNEFFKKVGCLFHMYTPDKFIEHSLTFMNQQVNEEVIREIVDLRNKDEQKNNNDVELGLTIEEIQELLNEANEYKEARIKPTIRLAENNEIYEIGDKVTHRKWGTGLVIHKEGIDEDTELLITFPNPIGNKKLLSKFAPIKKIRK